MRRLGLLSHNQNTQQIHVNEPEFSTFKKFAKFFVIQAINSTINFYVYKMDDMPVNLKDSDTTSIREFCQECLGNQQFNLQFLTSRLIIKSCQLKVLRILENSCDALITTDSVMLQHPKFPHKMGLLSGVNFQLKIPLERRFLNDASYVEIKIDVDYGVLNLNKKFVQSFVSFFVQLDTLIYVQKHIRRLLLKQNFQDMILYEFMRMHYKNKHNQVTFYNHRDTAIPKRFEVCFYQGIQIIATDCTPELLPYLNLNNDTQVIYACIKDKIVFQLIRTPKDSYYTNLSFQNLTIEVDGQTSLQMNNYSQDVDFTFKRENTQLPVKRSRLELSMSQKCDKADINMSPNLLKVLNNFVHFYLKNRQKAAIKHFIVGKISDRDFLLANIINNNARLNDDQILEIYELLKHQDIIQARVQIPCIKIKHDQVDSCWNQIQANVTLQGGTETYEFTCSEFQADARRKLPLIKAQNFKWQKYLIHQTSPANTLEIGNTKAIFKQTTADRIQLNVDLELVLDFTKDIINYQRVQSFFSQNWNKKYCFQQAINQAYKNSLIQSQSPHNYQDINDVKIKVFSNDFYFDRVCLIWNLSKRRLVCMNLNDFKPLGTRQFLNLQQYAQGKVMYREEICYRSSSGNLVHRLDGVDQDQIIIQCPKEIEMKIRSNKNLLSLEFKFFQGTLNLPNNFHWGSVVNEIIKQVRHCSEWFDLHSSKPKKQPHKKALSLKFDIQRGKFSWDEDPIKIMLIEKDEIAQMCAERDIFKLNPQAVLNLKSKFKKQELFRKYLEIEFQELIWTYELPIKFLSDESVFERIKQLDEADQYLKNDQFEFLRGAVNSYTFKYMAWHARHMIKPVIEMWGFDFKMDSITALLNTSYNPQLFQQRIERKIFNRFSMPIQFNKLVNKWYYDGQMKVQKFNVCMQGKQFLQFNSDVSDALSRLMSLTDISKSLDQNRQQLPYFSGLDRIRNKNHGQLKLKLKEINLEIWPKRRLNKFLSKILVQCFDFEYLTKNLISQDQGTDLEYPVDLQHDVKLRSLIVQKVPQAQYESALLNIPLLESQLFTNYNQKRSLNHYAHQLSQNMEDYLQHIQNYQLKDLFVEIKVNIPCLGVRNATAEKSLYLPLLMQSYVANSPQPVIHYQRSHLKILDEILQEYVGLIDVCQRVEKRKASKQISMVKQNRVDQFCIKAKGMIENLVILFSDFDSQYEQFGDEMFADQILDPDDIQTDKKRDNYLARYQGIMISTENICVKTLIQVNKGSERIKFNNLDSFFKINFLKMTAINGKNLFNSRRKCVQNEQSVDQYQNFCKFFEIANRKENQGFNTLFPEYVLNNDHIQSQITLCNNDSLILEQENFVANDFNFKESDTIGIIPLIKYEQNKAIIITDQQQLKVRHVFEVENMRFLFTVKIKELVIHYLVKGFDLRQFRKNNFQSDPNQQQKQQDDNKQEISNLKNLKKEAFIALVLFDPQINCQNDISKSQLLIAFETTTTAVIYSYSEPEMKKFKQNNDDIVKMSNVIMPDVVKYELQMNYVQIDCYVAPTYINLVNPTFWAADQQESVLRKIISCNDLSFCVEIFCRELVNSNTPQYGIDLQIKSLNCEMDGPSMFHFVSCIHLLLLSRGEKSAELILIERAKQRDLDQFGVIRLKQMIDDEVKLSLYKLGIESFKPDLARKVQVIINNVEFSFINQDITFAQGKLESLSAKSMIYQNRESRSDIDVEKIQLYNLVDSDEYRKVLGPNNQFNYFMNSTADVKQQSMIKIRMRDKYVVVADAPWQCYDQVEIFIHPMAICLTQNFYQQLKFFIFENPLLDASAAKNKTNKFNLLINTQKLQEYIKNAKVFSHGSSSQDNQFSDDVSTLKVANVSHSQVTVTFPCFFRYFRINEIKADIIYFHKESHMMNIKSKPIKLKISPYISHGFFSTFKGAVDSYEKHCKKNFINQIPNFLFRTAAKGGQKVKEYKNDENDIDQKSSRQETQIQQQRKLLFGDFSI